MNRVFSRWHYYRTAHRICPQNLRRYVIHCGAPAGVPRITQYEITWGGCKRADHNFVWAAVGGSFVTDGAYFRELVRWFWEGHHS